MNKRIISWCLYDWANSAFATVILAAVLPVYFVAIVPEGGAILPLTEHRVPAASLWGYSVSLSMFILAVAAPILGALADQRGWHKKLLVVFCLGGCSATAALSLSGPGDYLMLATFFLLANFGFAGANIFYNAYLPLIAPPQQSDQLSARGYATGYIGGGIALALVFLIITRHADFGFVDTSAATTFCFFLTALWWLLFSIPAFYYLPTTTPRPASDQRWSPVRYVQQFKQLRHYKDLSVFLLAFLFYNDGIQTIISVSAVYARDQLQLERGTIIGCFLMIQFLAMPGSLLFARLSNRSGPLKAILLSLILFLGVCIYAFWIETALEFWLLGAVIAVILGGSQALSRSLYATLVPAEKSAEFFGFFTISARFASIFGPLLFALVADMTGNARYSILAISIFFIVGGVLLLFVNLERGRQRALTAPSEPTDRSCAS